VKPEEKKTALIVGVTGIVGRNLAELLGAQTDWNVIGLARRPLEIAGVKRLIAADLLDREALKQAAHGANPTHVFYCTWSRQETEAQNCEVNGKMLQNLLDVVTSSSTLEHVSLVTGLKHYLGSFESYGSGRAETPFREDEPRQPGLNFYYVQEDILFEEAAKHHFSWNVQRPHTIIGYALGNVMNMGVTLAVYGSLCRMFKRPFVFPGSQRQFESPTDVTDASLLAKHLLWAATTETAKNQAFNVVNGEVFRWRWLWPKLAQFFEVEAIGYQGQKTPLEQQMTNAAAEWKTVAEKYSLRNTNVEELASWWHTDADLGRDIECFTDMTKSRELGFLEYKSTLRSFLELFERLRADRIIP
jgi:nucleoside-diphosphate-sugar epimerase